MTSEEDLLLCTDHVKYRKAGEGRSPIGRMFIYRELVQWKDNASPEVLTIKFVQIIGQKVSAPSKPKVQLQLCLHNDDQATFVFLDPEKTREALLEQRDSLKETLQQALLAHRARVNQLAASNEKNSKSADLEAKQRILQESSHLEQLYQHLVGAKFIKPDEFWEDYYKTSGLVEDKAGISGAFLSTIAQQDGANGIKLNLNSEIIKAIFDTYPAVQRKHLELVPHELSENAFWTKCFQSHYFHREREVLPNPNDPFADCVKMDDSEIQKLVESGVKRQRVDLEHIDDNLLRDFVEKGDSYRPGTKTTLIRRCNYLSERIIDSLKAKPSLDSTTNSSNNLLCPLEQVLLSNEERLESAELGEYSKEQEQQQVKLLAGTSAVEAEYPADTASAYKNTIINFFGENTNEDILSPEEEWFDVEEHVEESPDNGQSTSAWNLTASDLNKVRTIHCSVSELLKHFWTCFPATTPALQEKVERVYQAIMLYHSGQLQEAAGKFGKENVQHCFDMIDRAALKYKQHKERSRK